jgi:hypothetical protein
MSTPTQTTPNQYHLQAHKSRGHEIHIDYYPEGTGDPVSNGRVYMKYQDQVRSIDFYGNDVRVVQAPGDLGTIVSVTIDYTVDSGDTTFSLVVPNVAVPSSGRVQIETLGVTTKHYVGISPVEQPQRETYAVTNLNGAAATGPLPA